MLLVRREQLAALQDARALELCESIAQHLRLHMPRSVGGLDERALLERVRSCIASARSLGLARRVDLLRFANLAAVHGWTFADDPDLAWMRAVLESPDHGTPTQRLEHLARACIRRLEIETRNRRLRDGR